MTTISHEEYQKRKYYGKMVDRQRKKYREYIRRGLFLEGYLCFDKKWRGHRRRGMSKIRLKAWVIRF